MDITNLGTPKGTQDIQSLVTVGTITLAKKGHSFALVQIRKNGGAFTNDKQVGVYRVDNGDPASATGFFLGDGDYRLFSKGELNSGVKFQSAESGITGQIIIQYYNN